MLACTRDVYGGVVLAYRTGHWSGMVGYQNDHLVQTIRTIPKNTNPNEINMADIQYLYVYISIFLLYAVTTSAIENQPPPLNICNIKYYGCIQKNIASRGSV
jgi:uncharacterized protein with PQ loop repeat